MRPFLLAALLLAGSSPACASHTLPVRVCTIYDYTLVGNPVTKTTTRCFDAEMSGPSPESALERAWAKIRVADAAEPRLWEDVRTVARERSYLTVALRRVTVQILPNGPTRSADFPASGPQAVFFERHRVWLRGEDYKFDYYRRGGRGPEKLLDIGRPIGTR